MFDSINETPDWVPPSERWFPGPGPEPLDPYSEDPYSPDPYSQL
jgi:hypothetical protein